MPTLAPSVYRSILDLKTQNWEGGSDERYDVNRLTPVGDGRYTFGGQYYFDNEGRPLDAIPGARDWTPGLPGARGGTGPGSPSTGSYLAGDTEYNQLMQDLRAQSIADKSARDAAIKRSFINFGLGNFDLSKAASTVGIGDLASILDPQTLEVARDNPFSVQKRIERGLADRQRENRVSLRQRGATRSTGEHGFLAQRAQTDFDTDIYDSTQKLLDYISGAQSAYAQAENERKRREFEAAMAAASRYGGGGGGGGGYEEDSRDWSFSLAPFGNYLFGGVDQLLSTPAPPKRPAAPTSRDIKTGPYRNAGGV